jgi:hypothetical protein
MAMRLRILAAAVVVSCFGMGAFGEEVDNPAYVSWAKYKVGTTVTMKQSMDMPSMPQMKNESTMTEKLLEVKPEAVVVETTSKTTMMGQTHESTTKMTIKAKVEKGSENVPPQMADQKVEMKDVKEGKETVEVKGQKMEATTREYTMTIPASAMGGMGRGRGAGAAGGGDTTAHVKVWSSPEVPGGMVKTEQSTEMAQMGTMKITMEVTDYTVVK